MSAPHIVLVHGAYHRAVHFKSFKFKLEEAGYQVSTIDLPSASYDAYKLPPSGALRADVEAVKTLLEEVAIKSESIVPVFHSYGGVPGGEAAAELSDSARAKVKRLVFVSAFVLPQGYAVFTLSGGNAAPWAEVKDGAVFVPDPIPVFYGECESDIAKEAAAHVVPSAHSAFTEETKHTPWNMYPSTYIFCSRDAAVPPELQRAWFDMMSEEHRAKWDSFAIDSDHSPFLSKPNECAGIIRKIAGEDLPFFSSRIHRGN